MGESHTTVACKMESGDYLRDMIYKTNDTDNVGITEQNNNKTSLHSGGGSN